MNKQRVNVTRKKDSLGNNKKKYESGFFIEKYVSLWAYGYKNGIGYSEGLYRTINELAFSSFDRTSKYKILDVGCGVGRTTADLARFFESSEIVGIDSAQKMIKMARRLHLSDGNIMFDMNKIGFGRLSVECKKTLNLEFKQIGLNDFYEKDKKGSFDLITAVNFIDRVTDVKNSLEIMFALLKKGGVLILCTPLNFLNTDEWKKCGSYESLRNLTTDVGFLIDLAFDHLVYKEVLDSRGAIEEYPTIVMKLTK